MLVGIVSLTRAQDYPRKEIDIDNFIQSLFQFQEDDVDYEDFYESLFQLYRDPLDLNTASKEELRNLYILSESHIKNLFDYREKVGRFLSIYELQNIPGFSEELIRQLVPFVTIREKSNTSFDGLLGRIASEENNYLILRYFRVLEQKKGYKPTTDSTVQRYMGSPDVFYTRWRVSRPRDFSIGFTLEKDAGEPLAWDPPTRRYGPDFASYHIVLQNKGRWKNIAIGDYQLQFGQGLLAAAGFNVGKGAETVLTVRRSHLGIRPYSSVLESGFFRGAAATYNLGSFDLTAFYSNRNIDGNIQQGSDTLETEEDFISSVQITGFHRTPNEIRAKSSINEQVYGTNLLYNSLKKDFQAGLTFIGTSYSVPLKRTPSDYNQYAFNGKSNYNVGGFFTYTWQNFNFFGEAARSKSGGIGALGGFMASLSPKLDISMLYRYYARDFHSFYGSAFGEAVTTRGARNNNEQGIYWGLKFSPSRKYTFAVYFDHFKFPWLRYQADAPSQGYEYLARFTYKPLKTVTLYAQYRQEMREMNMPDNQTKTDFLTERIRRNALVNLDVAMNKMLSLKSRVQVGKFQFGAKRSTGYVILQDVTVDLKKVKLSTRFAVFDTDDYDTRQYVYEKDVLYSFSFPAYYGTGIRYYLLLEYNFTRRLDCWIRYARTSLRNTDTIGSGLEEIQGNTRSDLRVQVRYKF